MCGAEIGGHDSDRLGQFQGKLLQENRNGATEGSNCFDADQIGMRQKREIETERAQAVPRSILPYATAAAPSQLANETDPVLLPCCPALASQKEGKKPL